MSKSAQRREFQFHFPATECTGWSKSLCAPDDYNNKKLQVVFKVSPASLQTFTDTTLTLTLSAITNSNYVITVSDRNYLKYFCVFFVCTVIIRRTENFWSPCRFRLHETGHTSVRISVSDNYCTHSKAAPYEKRQITHFASPSRLQTPNLQNSFFRSLNATSLTPPFMHSHQQTEPQIYEGKSENNLCISIRNRQTQLYSNYM
jgi:hypothetical protein